MSLCSNCINFAKELSTRHRSECYRIWNHNCPWYIRSDFEHLTNASDPSASAKTCPLCWLFLGGRDSYEAEGESDEFDTMEEITDMVQDIPAEVSIFGGSWMSDNLSLHRLCWKADRAGQRKEFLIYATPGMCNDVNRSNRSYAHFAWPMLDVMLGLSMCTSTSVDVLLQGSSPHQSTSHLITPGQQPGLVLNSEQLFLTVALQEARPQDLVVSLKELPRIRDRQNHCLGFAVVSSSVFRATKHAKRRLVATP